MSPEEYELKKAIRIERLRARGERAARASSASIGHARERLSRIEPGQPILVGHHSEKRHRRDLAKIDAGMRKGFALADEAKALERRAAHAEASTTVSSDDPAAVVKLKEKLAGLERDQERMKAGNAAIRRKASPEEIARVTGLSLANAAKLYEKDFAGRIGFPAYALTNNSSEIRRVKARIEELEKKQHVGVRATEGIGEVRIEEEENRVRMFFPGKPDEKMRTLLKSRGFRWSPTAGAWQRMASPQAWYQAREIATLAARQSGHESGHETSGPCTCGNPACATRVARGLTPFCKMPAPIRPVETGKYGSYSEAAAAHPGEDVRKVSGGLYTGSPARFAVHVPAVPRVPEVPSVRRGPAAERTVPMFEAAEHRPAGPKPKKQKAQTDWLSVFGIKK